MAIGRYVVPVEVLRKNSDVTVAILRLGALANALNAVTGMGATAVSTGVGAERDTQQTVFLVVSYLKEAIDVLHSQRLWPLIESAVSKGFQLPHSVAQYRELFSPNDKQGVYQRFVKALRDTKGFHVDSEKVDGVSPLR